MPVDRMLMRPWLEEQINSASINNLVWLNKQKKIFQIPWMHAARHGWELDKDAPLFMNWAIHTGKYHPGVDQPDPKTWKANFRCAMNSLPDIEEVKDKSIKKGSNAFKVYRMLTTSERSMKKEKRKLEKEQNKAKKRKSGDDTSSKGSDGPTPEEEEKVEHEADSTVTIDLHPTVSDDSTDNQLVINEMPDVCAVVEVTTELEEVSDSQVSTKREEPPITSSTIYPRLQVSPISSCGESDAESEYSDEDSKEEWDMRCLSEPRVTCSVVRFPSCKAPSNSTFFNSEKINFKVTSCQEESPMIAYNIRPWWRPHLAIRPVPGRLHSGPQVQPRYSSHKRPQHIQHVASEICPPVHPHTSTQVPTQTNINVRAQTISHMFSPRSPHMLDLTSPHQRPQTSSPLCPQTSLIVHRSVAPQNSFHMPSPIGPQTGLHMLYPGRPHMLQQSGSHRHPQTNPQLSPHTGPHVSPQIGSHVHPLTISLTSLHGNPHMPAQACPDSHLQKSSQMLVLARPDVSPHSNPDVIPHSSTHTSVQVPIIKTPHISPINVVPLRQSSPPERTCSTDGRASVIVNTGVKS